MKKVLIGLAITAGIIMFLYGSLAAMVNQGVDFVSSVVIFILVVLGSIGLLWVLKDKPESTAEGKQEE